MLFGTGQVLQDLRVGRATYDFDTHGGTMADAIGLGTIIPKGAVVILVTGSVNTTLASLGAATIAINIGAVEFNVATAFDHADYVLADVHWSGVLEILADSEINIDIAGADLTAGNYDIFVKYYMGTGNDSV